MISLCLSTECTDKDVDLVCGGCSGAAHGSSEERCTSCICDQLILFCFILFYPIVFQQATTIIRQHASVSAHPHGLSNPTTSGTNPQSFSLH